MIGNRQPQNIKEQYIRIKIFTERGVQEYATIDLLSASDEIRIGDLQCTHHQVRRPHCGGSRSIHLRTDGGQDPRNQCQVQVLLHAGCGAGRHHRVSVETVSRRLFLPVFPSLFQRDILPGRSAITSSLRILPGSGWAPDEFPGLQREERRIQGNARGVAIHHRAGRSGLQVRSPHASRGQHPLLDAAVLLQKRNFKPDKYWREMGKAIRHELRNEVKVDGSIRRKPRADFRSVHPTEKIDRILDYCLNHVKNIQHDRSGVTAEQA